MINMKMSLRLLLIISLLHLALANIEIILNVDHNDKYTVTGNGRSISHDYDVLRDLFSITDARLADGVEALAGSRPNRVYLSEPASGTPYLDNAWTEVNAITSLTQFQMDPITRRKIFVDKVSYITGDSPLTVNIGVRMAVRHEARNVWFNMRRSDDTFDYNLVLDNRRQFLYSNKWGMNHTEVLTSNLASETLPLTIPAQTNVTVTVNRNSIQTRTHLIYSTHLSGHVVGYWSRGHQGRNYWAFDVQPVLRFGGMPIQAFTRELLDIFYNLGYDIEYRYTEDNEV